jgi:hypothetical protein
MRENFQKFNEKYFGGELPQPQFKVAKMRDEWGRFELPGARFSKITRKIVKRSNNGVLLLTSAYDRNENAVISTLLHEMTHEYVYLVNGVYPRNPHGEEFMSIANRINADGWNIADGVEMTDNDTVANEGEKSQCLLFVVYDKQSEKCWHVGRADENEIDKFCDSAKKIGGNIWIYSCRSKNLGGLKSDPNTLLGFGGTSYQEAAANLARYCGEPASIFSVNNMKRIK